MRTQKTLKSNAKMRNAKIEGTYYINKMCIR